MELLGLVTLGALVLVAALVLASYESNQGNRRDRSQQRLQSTARRAQQEMDKASARFIESVHAELENRRRNRS